MFGHYMRPRLYTCHHRTRRSIHAQNPKKVLYVVRITVIIVVVLVAIITGQCLWCC